MPKYIVEQLMTYRNVYVVEAENETQATKVAENADDNWQKFLGTTNIDINEYTEERIAYFKEKDYFPETTGAGRSAGSDALAVFDVDADGWRSFRWDSIKTVKLSVESANA